MLHLFRIKLFCILFLSLFLKPLSTKANIDSLLNIYKSTTNFDKKIALTAQLSKSSLDYKVVLNLLNKLVKENSKPEQYINKGRAITQIADLYISHNTDSSIFFYNKALTIFQKKDTTQICRVKNGVAITFVEKGEFNKALKLYLEILAYYKQIKDSTLVSNVLSNIGNLHVAAKNYDLAINFSKEALKYNPLKFYNNYIDAATVLSNIGMVFGEREQYDSASYYFKKTLVIYKKIDYEQGILNAKNNICACIGVDGDESVAKAIKCFEELVTLQLKNNDNFGLVSSYINMASLHNALKNYDVAIRLMENLISSKKMASSIEVDAYKDIYALLTESYKKTKRYNKAFFNNEKYQLYNDSLFNIAKHRLIHDLSTKYEVEKKNRELSEKDEKISDALNSKLVTELKLKKYNFWIIAFSGILLTLIFLSIIAFQLYKTKTEKGKNDAIILEKDKALIAIIDTQEKERVTIAKELHDGVGNNLLALQMLWKRLLPSISLRAVKQDNIKDMEFMLKEVIDDVRSVSHQMMPKVLSEFGLSPAIEDMLEKTIGHSIINYNLETHNLKGRYDSKLEISMFRILQELINNVIKHSMAHTVHVQLLGTHQYLILLVEDDGVGIKNGNVNDGIGFTNIKSRVALFKGELNINSTQQTGTSISIRIPI